MPIVSPLYNVLKNLVKKNFVIQNFKIKDMQQEIRNYFLIELDSPSLELIIQDYNLIDVHFSVDELYDPGVNSGYGYTPMHYTEMYFSLEENKYIVVHGYINSKGKYEYAQVKKLNESREFTGKFITLSHEQEGILKTKINQFKPMMDKILDEQIKLEKEKKQKADQLEIELTKLSRDLNQSNVRVKYLETARLFSQAVKEFNQYSFITDVRDKVILRTLKNIEIIHRCIESRSQEITVIEIPEPEEKEAPEDDSLCLPKDASLSELYKLTMQSIRDLMQSIKKIKSYTIENLILINQHAEQMHMQTLIFYTFPSAMIKKEDPLAIYQHGSKLNKYYEQYLSSLKESALAGELDEVKAFFPLLKTHLTENLYMSLIEKLVKTSLKEECSKIVEVCNYLNDRDFNYKNFISTIIETKKHPLPKKISDGIFTVEGNKATEASLLFMLYIENKFDIFEMLLHHGLSADTWGISFKPSYPLESTIFYSITCYRKKDYLKYLEKLLEYNADCNIKDSKNTTFFGVKIKSQVTQMHLKSSNNKLVNKRCIENATYNSSFLILVKEPGVESVFLILGKTKVLDLCYSLVRLFENSVFRKTMTLATEYVFMLANNKMQADSIAEKMATLKSRMGLFLSYIAYPNPANDEEDVTIAKDFIQKINIIDKFASNKIMQLDLENFQAEYDQLFKIAEDEFLVKEWHSSFFASMGCEYMLMRRAFGLYKDPKEIKRFVKQYSSLLYKNLEKIIPKIFSGEGANVRVSFYKNSKDSFLESDFNSSFKLAPDKKIEYKFTRTESKSKTEVFEPTPALPLNMDVYPLCVASKEGDEAELNKLLLVSSFVLNQKYKGWTPLHFACGKGKLECAKMLILSGARIDIDNDKGKKALELLKDKTQAEVLKKTYARIHSS